MKVCQQNPVFAACHQLSDTGLLLCKGSKLVKARTEAQSLY